MHIVTMWGHTRRSFNAHIFIVVLALKQTFGFSARSIGSCPVLTSAPTTCRMHYTGCRIKQWVRVYRPEAHKSSLLAARPGTSVYERPTRTSLEHILYVYRCTAGFCFLLVPAGILPTVFLLPHLTRRFGLHASITAGCLANVVLCALLALPDVSGRSVALIIGLGLAMFDTMLKASPIWPANAWLTQEASWCRL